MDQLRTDVDKALAEVGAWDQLSDEALERVEAEMEKITDVRPPTAAERFRMLRDDVTMALGALDDFAQQRVSDQADRFFCCKSWQDLRQHLLESDNYLRAWRE